MEKISLVIPCYNEEKNIVYFHEETNKIFEKEKVKIEMKKLIRKNPEEDIKCLNFSRNFGKEAAIIAGLEASTGDYVSIIDADMQQNPKYVLKMYEFLKENSEYDSVACYQEKRRENKIIAILKKWFYHIINRLSMVDYKENASDFRLLKRKVVDAIIKMQEYYRFSKGIFSYVGFETYYMPYEVDKRRYGKSKFSFIKLCKYAIDGIVSFSLVPLKIATFIGSISFIASLIYLIYIIIQKLTIGIEISGYATIVCLILFFGGIQLIILGIIGAYLGRVYIETKRRPKYILEGVYKIDNMNN